MIPRQRPAPRPNRTKKPTTWKLSEPQKQEIMALYRGGMSGHAIAALFPVTKSAVYHLLRDYGIPRRPTGRHRQGA